MKNSIKAIQAGFFLSLFLIVGCAHIPFMKKSDQGPKAGAPLSSRKEPLLEANAFVTKGKIVDAQSLQQRKNIAIIPFKAGAGVEATEALDRVALMIVKGVSDAFASDSHGRHDHFNVVTAENSQSADLIVQGHVVDVEDSSKISRMVLFKRKKGLGVSGKMTNAQTGETILVFNDHVETSEASDDLKRLGYRIGKNIGRFILSGIK